MEKGKYEWEKCPKCGGVSIEWRGDRRSFRCLNRACLHEWREWPGGPKIYAEVQNKYLRASLCPHLPVPYADRA